MIQKIAHKIELDPNNKQRGYFAKACGISRFAYNWGLAEWNRLYELNKTLPDDQKIRISGMTLRKMFNEIKHEQFPWVSEVTTWAATQAFVDLQRAFDNFFRKFKAKKGKASNPKKRKNGIEDSPQFKKKCKCIDSFYLHNQVFRIEGQKILIPKLGWVRMKETLRFDGRIIAATVSRSADKWFVAIQVETDIDIKTPPDKSVGIDLGIKSLMMTSDGHSFNGISPLKNNLKKLKREQRKLSRRLKSAKQDNRKLSESKNFQKQKQVISKLHYKITCQRKDIQHKVTTAITSNYKNIAIENLNVKGMTKNHKLARSISDVGFFEVRRQLEYKAKMKGGHVSVVDRWFPSSKTCSNCGEKKEDLTLKDRTFVCNYCGFKIDRDYNAAINLKKEIGTPDAELTPVEITAMQRAVSPLVVTSIVESGSQHKTAIQKEPIKKEANLNKNSQLSLCWG